MFFRVSLDLCACAAVIIHLRYLVGFGTQLGFVTISRFVRWIPGETSPGDRLFTAFRSDTSIGQIETIERSETKPLDIGVDKTRSTSHSDYTSSTSLQAKETPTSRAIVRVAIYSANDLIFFRASRSQN